MHLIEIDGHTINLDTVSLIEPDFDDSESTDFTFDNRNGEVLMVQANYTDVIACIRETVGAIVDFSLWQRKRDTAKGLTK